MLDSTRLLLSGVAHAMLPGMDLSSYYKALPQGGRKALAERIGTSPTFLYQMATGRRPVPDNLCVPLEKETQGEVSLRDLRPVLFGLDAATPPAEEAA